MKHLYSYELLEEIKKGKKEFDEILLEFAELNDQDFSGLVIRNSKINYVQFRFSNLKGAKFINCEIFFVSFFGAEMENTVFDKCKIEMARFDEVKAKNMRITNCNLSYCLMMGLNQGELNLDGTSEFKTIKNPADATDDDIEVALKIVGNRIGDLPLEIRSELHKRISATLKDHNRNIGPIGESKGGAYSKTGQYSRAANLYKALDKISDGIIKYGSSEVYKSKKKDMYKE